MTININLTPEQEAEIAGEAQRLGVSIQEYALWKLLSRGDEAAMPDVIRKAPHGSALAEHLFEWRAEPAEAGGDSQSAWQTSIDEASRLHLAGRFDEEYAALEETLIALPQHETAKRLQTVAKLIAASHSAGHNGRALDWAKQLLASDADPMRRFYAYRMAGIAANGLGLNQEANRYYRDGYEAATRENRPEDAAKSLLLLADVQCQEGLLEDALQTAERVIDIWPHMASSAWSLRAEALAFQGRYEESVEAYETAIGLMPPEDGRSRALITLGLARADCQLRRLPEARKSIQEAGSVLSHDPKLGLWCDSAECWLLALEGSASESQAKIADLLARIEAYAEDRNTQLACLGDIARAATEMKLRENAVEYGRLYLAQRPTKADRPFMLALIGENELALGHPEEAMAAFKDAADGPEQVYYTELAAERLVELDGSLQSVSNV